MHYFRLKSLIATVVIMVRHNIEGNARLPVFEGSEVRPLMDWGGVRSVRRLGEQVIFFNSTDSVHSFLHPSVVQHYKSLIRINS